MNGVPAADARAPSLRANTAYNALHSLASLLVGMILTPVLLRHLGVEGFGFWSLLWAIAGSLAVVDLRIGSAVTRFVADAWARGDLERLARVARAGLTFYLVLGVLEVALAGLLLGLPAQPLAFPEAVSGSGRLALVAAVAAFAVSSAASVFAGVLQGLQRFDLTALVAIGATLGRGAGLLGVVAAGGGVAALVLVEGLVALAQGLALYGQARRLLPGLRLAPGGPAGPLFRELGAFGLRLQVAHLAFLASFHGDKLLLSLFLGLPAVAFYEVGSKVAYVMRGLPLLLVSAVGPVASALEAGGARGEIWRFYLRGTSLLVAAGTPLLVFTTVGAGAILRLWIGEELPEARQAVRLLAVGYYVNLLSGMAHTVAVGMGRPDLEMRRSLLVTGLNLGLSASLIPLLGFVGAPLGTALALVAGTLYLLGCFHAAFGQPLGAVLTPLRPALLLALPTGAAAWLLIQAGHGWGDGRWPWAVVLSGAGLLIGGTYVLLAVRGGVVRAADLRAVQARLVGR
jgi:O-antigen/teichoic acid export membrane protein